MTCYNVISHDIPYYSSRSYSPFPERSHASRWRLLHDATTTTTATTTATNTTTSNNGDNDNTKNTHNHNHNHDHNNEPFLEWGPEAAGVSFMMRLIYTFNYCGLTRHIII